MTDTEERTRLVVATHQLFDEYTALVGELDEADSRVRSLCPDWSVRECLAHAVAIEQVLTGWTPSTGDPPPFDEVTTFMREAAAEDAGAFRDRVTAVLDARRAELARLGADDLAAPSITPVGVQTYGRFLAIRVFDLWVHERDCTIPLGRRTHDGGDPAEITVDEIERSIGYIVGRRIGLPDGMSIRFDLTGPVVRSLAALVVEGRARPVDPGALDAPDVVVTSDSTTFVLLACGRLDPGAPIAEGAISWTGDDEWGERAARNLRFTR